MAIIGFCGRKESGKSELGKICTDYGYERLYFALPLKNLICQLLSCSEDELNALKSVESKYIFKNDEFKLISRITNIDFDIISKGLKNKTFKNVREILQYIGTDVIRAFNPNWHVEQLEKIIKIDVNYVIDDVRFPNEADLIRKLNGDLWYIIRPKIDNISNHSSETSLRWQDFNNLIINDGTVEDFKAKWNSFMKNGYSNSKYKRAELINRINKNPTLINDSENRTLMKNLYIQTYELDYNDFYLHNSPKKIDIDNNNLIVDGNKITNPLMIEDLKFFL